jgi:hypothetical protein
VAVIRCDTHHDSLVRFDAQETIYVSYAQLPYRTLLPPLPHPPSHPPIGRNPSAMLLSLSPLQEDEAGNTIELLHSDSESQGPGSGPGPPATSSAAKRDLKKGSSARVYRISVCAGVTLCASLYFKPSKSKVWDFELPLRLQGILSEKMSFSEGACLCIVCCMQHVALMKYRGFDVIIINTALPCTFTLKMTS